MLGAMTALAQTPEPAAVSSVTTTGVTVAVTNVHAPATTPVAVVTNQPAAATHPPASIVSTGATHAVSVSNKVAIPAFPATETPEAVPETTGYLSLIHI